MEQYGRRNNIRIVGLRNDKPFETSQDTAWQVVNFINDKMDINISVHQIDIAHRLGPYSRDTNRNIIVRLISRQVKFNVLTHCKELKKTGVYINEDLTHTNQKVLSSMRLKDPKTVERAWSYEGKLYLRRKGANENELITYSHFDEWLNLPWPKKK